MVGHGATPRRPDEPGTTWLAGACGLRLTLFTLDGMNVAEVDDLVGLGEVISDPTDGWVAVVLPATLRHASELDPIDRRLYLDLRPQAFSGSASDRSQG